jgi:hypothetical protein
VLEDRVEALLTSLDLSAELVHGKTEQEGGADHRNPTTNIQRRNAGRILPEQQGGETQGAESNQQQRLP